MVSQVGVEVILRVTRRFDGFCAVEYCRMPLVGVAANESVEILEAQSGGPEVEWPSLARLPVGHVVILTIPGRVPAVLLKDFRHRASTLRHHRVVAGKARAELGDNTGGTSVMVTSSNQR